MREFLDRAYMTHAVIKQRLRDKVLSPKPVDPESILSDRTCEYGEWLYGEGFRTHGHLPEFHDLKAIHAAFHKAAHDAYLLMQRNQRDEALKVLESGDFELRSQEMKNGLIRLKSASKRSA